VDAAVTFADGTTQYYYLGAMLPASAWTQAKAEFDIPAGAVSVTVFHLIAAKGYLTTDDYGFAPYSPPAFNRGLVTLTFDDGWTSQYTNAFPLLKKYGLKATFYILSGELTDQPDYMTAAQVKALYAGGNEIASHTVNHPDLTTLGATKLNNQLLNSQTKLQSVIGAAVLNFASPYGAYNATTITAIKKYYKSHRSTDVGYNTKDNFDPYNLRVQNIYSTTTPAQVQAWVDQAAKDKTWLILVYHEVANTPVDPTDDLYTTKPADLDAEMSIVKNSGLGVVTIDQGLNEVTPQATK
jgi:peptidoglycan/xylan/chitin deacetylase (PgdA/CDA1 family)